MQVHAVRANRVDSPRDATRETGGSKARRLLEAVAAHLRHVGRTYPAAGHRRAVLRIDSAPWHAGEVVRQALADNPRPGRKRLPSDSPQLNPVERLWRVLRRRATHNRRVDTRADRRRSPRSRLGDFQTARDRVRTGLNRQPRTPTASPGS